MPVVKPRVERLEPGDRLLLYTDGLAEARREGEFFPIGDRAWGLLGHGTVADGLASLESALVRVGRGSAGRRHRAGADGVRRRAAGRRPYPVGKSAPKSGERPRRSRVRLARQKPARTVRASVVSLSRSRSALPADDRDRRRGALAPNGPTCRGAVPTGVSPRILRREHAPRTALRSLRSSPDIRAGNGHIPARE